MTQNITVIGNLVADPEERRAGGKDVLNLKIADNLGYYDKRENEFVETGTVFYGASIWRSDYNAALFDNILDSFHKGDRVIAVVQLKGEGVRAYESKNGDLGAEIVVDIVEIAASVKFAVVDIERNKKSKGSTSKRARDEDEGDEEEAPKRQTRSRRSSNEDADDQVEGGSGEGEEEAPARSTRGRASSRTGRASRSRSTKSESGSDEDAF